MPTREAKKRKKQIRAKALGSQRGLARACGKHHKTIQNLEKYLATKSPSKWL